ncbi:hypothetical protein OSL58_20320, partial [Escherichia coli]|nr:hypothetical protein [Escherichia coli]
RRAESSTATVYQYDNGLLNFLGIPQQMTPRLLSSGPGIAGESLFYVIASALLSTTASSVLSLSSQ